jgi:hypothetical protein
MLVAVEVGLAVDGLAPELAEGRLSKREKRREEKSKWCQIVLLG